jgi:predicted RecA/RadA family phage recombinase
MSDATLLRGRTEIRKTAAAAIASGAIHQLADGSAGVYTGLNAAASGDPTNWKRDGQYIVTKTSGVVILDGNRVYWDHSAGSATYKKVDDRDFYLGRAVGDAASGDTTLVVNLNVDPPYDLDLMRDPGTTVPIGTQALGGFLPPRRLGGAIAFDLTATSEAQKVDLISVDGFSKDANAIVEVAFRVPTGGSGAAVDYSIGIANASHATDADSITDSVFIHIDGGSTNLNLESDDGTTEVAATDTTADYTAGTTVACREEWWFDMRNPADIQIYRNGVLQLPSSVFNVDASVATWHLLVHLEKTTGTTTADLIVDWMRARLAKQ